MGDVPDGLEAADALQLAPESERAGGPRPPLPGLSAPDRPHLREAGFAQTDHRELRRELGGVLPADRGRARRLGFAGDEDLAVRLDYHFAALIFRFALHDDDA